MIDPRRHGEGQDFARLLEDDGAEKPALEVVTFGEQNGSVVRTSLILRGALHAILQHDALASKTIEYYLLGMLRFIGKRPTFEQLNDMLVRRSVCIRTMGLAQVQEIDRQLGVDVAGIHALDDSAFLGLRTLDVEASLGFLGLRIAAHERRREDDERNAECYGTD